MKKVILSIMLFATLISCNDEAKHEDARTESKATSTTENVAPQFFGEKINADGAMPTDSIKGMMGDKMELPCKLMGKVDAVCQKKGCWMELKSSEGTTMRVTFKDYGFFMPKDCSGKTAIVDGMAKVEVTSVADLQEYAKDDGKSKEEIAAIKEPVKELVFEAKGVILQ